MQPGFYPFFGVNTPFDPAETFVTARFIPPKYFGWIRLLFAVYGMASIGVDIGLNGAFAGDDS
jgi:hypothetical protein